jgi:NAD(P)H dehydrogenase (quinone)
MIGVTGATGKLGRHAIAHLLTQHPAREIVALVRHYERAKEMEAQGIQVRHADYDAPATLGPALEGISKLLFISASEVGKRVPQHRALIDAAAQARVGLVAYTSILRADTSRMKLVAEHKATETALRASGIPFVLLRHGWYIENYTENLAGPLATGTFMGSAGTGRIAAVTRADFAEADVRALLGDRHAGKTYELASDAGFTMAELASAVSTWSGKPLAYRDMNPGEYAQALTQFGVPGPYAEVLADCDLGVARGELDVVGDDLRRLLGRPPRSLQDFLATLPRPSAG